MTDKQYCSAAFSTDGKIAVGYKGGGILVYSPYRSYHMGTLESVEVSAFFLVITFCTYADVLSLRNSCWYFHNLTKQLRGRWRLNGMRQDEYGYAVYNFVKYSRWLVLG